MANQTITAMFSTRAEADRAADALRSDLNLSPAAVNVLAGDSSQAASAATSSQSYEDRGFWSSLKNLFVPDEDRYAYAEGLSRGNFLVSASLEDTMATRAMDILEQHGAVDLDAHEKNWKQGGWQGYTGATAGAAAVGGIAGASAATAKPTMTTATSDMAMAGRPATGTATAGATRTGAATTGMAATAAAGDQTIQLAEETLRIGKRDVSHGRVRVRSYVVETPVSEQVTLRDEHVSIEHRAVDRSVTAADADLFRERTIEATETDEEAVVAKDVRIREELVLHKNVEQRTETVSDKVRRTEVEIEGDHPSAQKIATATPTTGTTATASANPLRKPV